MLNAEFKTLITVSECLNFTKAAEKLFLTQPAVSRHIHQLEEEFGVSLFIRGKGGLKITHEDEIVIQYARRMAALCDKLRLELADSEKHITKLRIGITHTAESNLTAEVLAKCCSEINGFYITVITDTINNLYTMIKNYEIDLAIVEGKTVEYSLNSFVLNTDFLVCVMSKDNNLSKNAAITLDQLKKENLILRLPTSATRILFDSTLRSLGDSPENDNISIELDNIATIKDLVGKNLGVSILPKSSCIKEVRKKKLAALPIENLSMVRETRIVYGKDFAHREIRDRITKVYQKTVKEY